MFKKYYCIKQNGVSDCGAACLATICKQNKVSISINKLIKLTKTDLNGTTIRGIINAAQCLNFSAKVFKVKNKEQLLDVNILPAIVKIITNNSYNHFVVIQKITNKYIIVSDPLIGVMKYNYKDFLQIWDGIIIILTKNINFKTINEENSLLKKYFNIIKPQYGLLFNMFISSLLITIFGIIGAFYFKFILNTVIPNNLISSLNTFSIGLLILVIFSQLISAFRRQLLIYFSQRIDISLMLGYYRHIINLPMDFIQLRTVGEIISRLDDAYKIRLAISSVTLSLVIDVFMAIIGGLFLFIESKYLFCITLIPLILYIINIIFFKKHLETTNINNMKNQAELNSYLVQCINGIETIKTFNYENEAYAEVEKKSINFIKSVSKIGIIINFQDFFKGTVKSLFSILIIWIGVLRVLSGDMSIGTLLTFNALLIYFLNPIVNILKIQPTLQSAIVAAQRLDEIVEQSIEKNKDELKKINLKKLKNNIEFKNLKFRYGSRFLILNDINIKIKKNEKIALIGESGSGKTTLVKLLMKFYSTEEGEILIDGLNINDINLNSLRNKIAYISQETFLFNKTIFENLTIGKNNISYEQVIEACKKAQIHDFINALPARYNTLVRENGINFSGGQKQRLSIARAILKNPDILIMDEATSNLDSITEKAINNTMNDFMKDKTAIIIAHRLSTIRNCDNIYVLKQGKIIESGNHNELINKRGFYYNLWSNQTLNPHIENLGGSTIE